MKHPSVRTASAKNWLPETHEQIKQAFLEFQSLLPFETTGFVILGSYAIGDAEFHSDLDVSIETVDRVAASAAMRLDHTQWSISKTTLKNRLMGELGLFPETFFDFHKITEHTAKVGYSILDGIWHNEGATLRVIWNKEMQDWEPKILPEAVRPPRYDVSYRDEDTGDLVVGVDKYLSIVEAWRNRLNGKMLEIGETEDTAYLRVA